MLGHATLGAPDSDSAQQSGVFEPQPPFDRVAPILNALQRAMLEFETEPPLPAPEELALLSREQQVQLLRATLGEHSVVRRIVESQRAVDAFALHLRDDHDREVPTQFIAIHRLPDDAPGPRPVRPRGASAAQEPPRYMIVARMEESPRA